MRKLRLVVFIMGKYQLAIFPPPLIARALPQQHFKITYPLMHFIVQFSLQYREKPSNVCHNYPKGTSDRQRPQMKNAFASLMFPTVTPHCPFPPWSLLSLSIIISIIVIIIATLLFNWQLVLPIVLVVSVAASRLNANQSVSHEGRRGQIRELRTKN